MNMDDQYTLVTLSLLLLVVADFVLVAFIFATSIAKIHGG